MFKKLIYLVSFVFVLSIAINAQAAPLPVSVDPAVEAVIGADALAPPDQAYNTYNLQICNYTSGRRVTLVSYDISGLLKDGQMFDNMSLSNLGIFAGGVDVYGVIEDQDNISGGLKWNNAPGVNNGQPIGYPVDLDKDDLSAKLLSFTAPGNNERKSTGTSQALDDFINSDTDGIVTFLLAPPKAGQNVLMKSGKYSDGGTILNGEITTGIDIIWVTDADDTGLIDRDGDGVQDDQDWIDFLNAELHNVDARLGNWMSLDDAKLAELNAADLVILSRTASSGDYDDDDEVAQWSSVTTPLISLSAWHLRSSRWKWIDSGDTQRSNMSYMEVLVPTHPIFEGVEIDADGLVEPVDPEIYSEPNGYQGTCFVNSIDMGNGVLLAKNLLDMAWIAIWKAGVEYYDGAGVAPASRRLYFMAGTENNSLGTAVIPQGDWNLTAAGETMFRNAIKCMLAQTPPPTAMVAHWPMDDGADTVVTDVVGGNDGTMVGNVAWIADGAMGGAVSFDGIDPNAHILVPHAAELDFGDVDFSISLWVRYPVEPTTEHRWIMKGSHGSPYTGSRYEVFIKGSNVRFAIDNGPANVKTRVQVDRAPFVTGEWVHAVAVRDAANDVMSLYADGVLLGSTTEETSGDISNGEELRIGNATVNAGSTMTGDIDDVRIFPTALTEAEIATFFWLD